MNANRHLPLPAKSFVAVILIVICVMFFMAWANVAFRGSGYTKEFVFNVSRIAGLPVMVGLVWLTVRQHQGFLARLFSADGLTLKLVVTGILIGVLARIVSWSLVTGRAAFGILPSALTSPPLQFQLAYACPNALVLITSVAAWFVLIPVTEELVHRGVVLSALANRVCFLYGDAPAGRLCFRICLWHRIRHFFLEFTIALATDSNARDL